MSSNAVSATPEQVKARIQDAYSKAVQNQSMFMSPSSPQITHVLRDVRLYGRDAGADFAETHLATLIEDAVSEARCRKPALTFQAYSCGRSAVAGMAARLAELTGMKAEANASAITLTWADAAPRML